MISPIQRKPVNYQPLSGIHSPVVKRVFQGVNTLDPLTIGEDFATSTKNIDGYPYLETRKGFAVLGSDYGKVIGMGVWKDQELHAIFSDGTWRKWEVNTWGQPLQFGLDVTKDWTFTNFLGKFTDMNLVASNGSQAKRYDGSAVHNLTSPTNINYIETFSDRLFGAVGQTLHFSSWRDGNDWTTVNEDQTDSGWVVVETSDGQDIVSVKPGIGHVTVFKRNSIHELYGYSPDSYEMRVVTLEIGAINNKSIINIGGTLYFMHDTGIYRYQGGTAPSESFSLPVAKYIENIDKGRTDEICASTDGRKLYFAIPDRMLVFDLLYEIWTVYEDTSPNVMTGWRNELYIGADRVYKTGLDSNGVNYEWITKPFGAGSLAQKVRWYRMYIVADVPTGSTLHVHLSKTIEGNDWTLAQTVNGADHIQQARIIIPVTTVADANWVRVKLSGMGYVKIHEFTRQYREMPLV